MLNVNIMNYQKNLSVLNFGMIIIMPIFKININVYTIEILINLYGCLEAKFVEDDKYECLKCDKDFIPLINDKTCRKISEINLSNKCIEAVNIGSVIDPIYSCNKCNNETALITGLNNINNCFERTNNLVFCLKGKINNNNNKICTECVSFANLNNSKQVCECNSDSIGERNIFCYKCDDEILGNPGCLASEGCEYRIGNNQFICNKCKSNYFEFTKGQCFDCFNEIEFCNKCKLNENDKFICENCMDNFIYNVYDNKCELNCEEHLDISPGCIICNEEYKLKGKCQACKPGYFKTNNETCIYCRSEKYGGPACSICGSNASDENILCVNCTGKDKALNSKGKCYKCQDELFNECTSCKFILNGNEEKLVCILCKEGYYLDYNGNCVNFKNYLIKNQNCIWNIYSKGDFSIYYSDKEIYYRFYYKEKDYFYGYYNLMRNFDEKIIEFINNNINTINHKIKGFCTTCNNEFYLTYDYKCMPLSIHNCTIYSMIKNNLLNECQNFCKMKKFPVIVLNLNNTDNEISYITISRIYYKYRRYVIERKLHSLINQTLCIDNSEDSKYNYLKYCIIAIYLEKEDKYICNVCDEGYFLNKITNQCMKFEENLNCEYENIGNISNPIFSCIKCHSKKYFDYNNDFYYFDYYYNDIYDYHSFYRYDDYRDYYSDYLLVKEGNISFCVNKESSLDNCLSADVDTTYAYNKYNCTSCLTNHLPYYSEFYEREICQSIFDSIKISQDIDFDYLKDYDRMQSIDGDCPNNTFFTPDGKNCYKCSNFYNGTGGGCKDRCIFSIERNQIIKCLDGCKDGYIESFEGLCEKCSTVNRGCNECHYENNYPNFYLGIRRKRKFICDNCDSNYYAKKDDKCALCNDIEEGCYTCQIENQRFKCISCKDNYILDNEGHCNYCGNNYFSLDNKCIKCNNVNQSGIEGCNSCERIQHKISCISCEEGYILLANNRTCLKIIENEELKKQTKCSEIILENNHFYCLKCNDHLYSVLKEDNEKRCIYLPELNGYVDDYNKFYYENLYLNEKNIDINNIFKYFYIKNIIHYFSYCLEVINLGSKDNPLYSCIKCNDSSNLFIDEKTNISYCIKYNNVDNYNDMKNCIEKKIKISDKTIKFTCYKCMEDNILSYNKIDKVYYCIKDYNTSNITDNICKAKNCKQCKLDDEYFCDICEFEDYIVNNITGACVKQNEVVPAITWKDIFRLEMNSEKEINKKKIRGPKLHLRGLTHSRIYSGHAFLIFLIFKIKQPLRNLEDFNDTIIIKAICEISKEVEENKDDINIVEYECIGDSNGTDLSNSTLEDIDVGNDTSNLEELKSSKDLLQIENGPTIEFQMDSIKNQTSNEYNFCFKIDGKIDDNLNDTEIDLKLKMNEINESSSCIFIIAKNKKANLNCNLNVENYKDVKLLTFNTTKVSNGNEYNISFVDLNKVYLINEGSSKTNKKNAEALAIIITVTSIIVVVGIIIAYYCLKRSKNKKLRNLKEISIKNLINNKINN